MSAAQDSCRAAFESSVENAIDLTHDDEGGYNDFAVNNDWCIWQQAWQAARARPTRHPNLILFGYWHTHAKLREGRFSKTPLQESDRRAGWVETPLYTGAKT